MLVHLHERVLDNVERVFTIAQHAVCDRIEASLISLDEMAERISFATLHARNECLVGEVVRHVWMARRRA